MLSFTSIRVYEMKGGEMMKMERVLIQLPIDLKVKLDGLRAKGTTISGFIRHLIEKEFANQPTKKGV